MCIRDSFKFLQCDHDRHTLKKKRVCSVTVGWNDKPPVKADACAGRAVLHCRFCGGGVSSVFGLRTIIKMCIRDRAGDKTNEGFQETDTFILSGYWEYDDLMPVHYINVSKDYVKSLEEKWMASGEKAFRRDLNVMLPSKLNIEQQMQKIDTDLGYDWNTRDQENSARIGVNWGLTASQLNAGMDPELLAAIAAFLLLVIFTEMCIRDRHRWQLKLLQKQL